MDANNFEKGWKGKGAYVCNESSQPSLLDPNGNKYMIICTQP